MAAGAPIVVKVGGSTLGSQDTTLADIARLHRDGERLVVVHGGGAAVTKALAESGRQAVFHEGLRVTDAGTLEVLIAVAAGTINTSLVAGLAALGVRAVGLTGIDGPTLLCRVDRPELGFVGAVERVDPALLDALLAGGYLPVMAPVGLLAGPAVATGQPLNLNADTAAGHVAAGIGARALVLLTDIEGVRDGDGALIPRLTRDRFEELRASGVISGGMLPKIASALVAVDRGVTTVIVDGRRPGALLAALAGSGGTTVVP